MHTKYRKYGITTPHDASSRMARSFSNTTTNGDKGSMKHETTQRLGINIKEKGLENRNKFRYKRATRKLPKDTKNTQISMQNPSAAFQELHYHPHLNINTSHTIWNPVTQAELTPVLLSIISPLTWITEFNYNPEIPDSHYANVYLPNTMLTEYKNGTLVVTTEAHAFACLHFNPTDCRILELTSLNAPDPEGHVQCINNAQTTRPSTPAPLTTNSFMTNNHLARSTTVDPQSTTTGLTHCLWCDHCPTCEPFTRAPRYNCYFLLYHCCPAS